MASVDGEDSCKTKVTPQKEKMLEQEGPKGRRMSGPPRDAAKRVAR